MQTTMWDCEGSGPYGEVTNEEGDEWGDTWNDDNGEGGYEWEEVKEEPLESWDDADPQTVWEAKSQPWNAPPPPPPPPPPAEPAQGAHVETWTGWNQWKGWGEWGDGNPKKWESNTWNPKWSKNQKSNWKPWKPQKAPWSSQKRSKPDGSYPKGGASPIPMAHGGRTSIYVSCFAQIVLSCVLSILCRFEKHHQFVWIEVWSED